jgi:hypothetical protein
LRGDRLVALVIIHAAQSSQARSGVSMPGVTNAPDGCRI